MGRRLDLEIVTAVAVFGLVIAAWPARARPDDPPAPAPAPSAAGTPPSGESG